MYSLPHTCLTRPTVKHSTKDGQHVLWRWRICGSEDQEGSTGAADAMAAQMEVLHDDQRWQRQTDTSRQTETVKALKTRNVTIHKDTEPFNTGGAR